MNSYENLKYQLRRLEERTDDYSDPWKYSKERQKSQKDCKCKNDPGQQKGTCGICNGWFECKVNNINS